MAAVDEKDVVVETEFACTDKLDSERGSRYAQTASGDQFRAAAIRKLFFKLDILLMPMIMCLYLCAYLDRGNLGNARLQGLEANALDGNDDKYSLALSCFYITYITCSVPCTLFSRVVGPDYGIAVGVIIWSIAASCQAAVQNPAGVYVCRLFIGLGEAFFGQAAALYLSSWYPKAYLAKRLGLYIVGGTVAGAFSGLIAFGVQHINSTIAQWRILFLIEGLPALVLAILVILILPNRPEKSRYLKEDERTLLLTLLNESNSNDERSLGLNWAGLRRAALDWKVYTLALAYSCFNLDLGSVGGYLPTIVKSLGYSDAQAQLHTVPPYVVALALVLLLTSLSDRTKRRGVFAASTFVIDLVGWAILLGTAPTDPSAQHARYFACFCIVSGAYTAIPLLLAWMSDNSPDLSQRAYGLGMLNVVGQCLSILASYSFPSNEGPRYVKGGYLNVGFQCLGFFICIGLMLYYMRENRRRDRVEGPKPPGHVDDVHLLFDKAPFYRYTT